jgi:hypothetical protein
LPSAFQDRLPVSGGICQIAESVPRFVLLKVLSEIDLHWKNAAIGARHRCPVDAAPSKVPQESRTFEKRWIELERREILRRIRTNYFFRFNKEDTPRRVGAKLTTRVKSKA